MNGCIDCGTKFTSAVGSPAEHLIPTESASSHASGSQCCGSIDITSFESIGHAPKFDLPGSKVSAVGNNYRLTTERFHLLLEAKWFDCLMERVGYRLAVQTAESPEDPRRDSD